MRLLVASFTAVLMLASTLSLAQAETKRVVVTLKPIHSLAAALMKGLGEPILLMDGVQDPHEFALRPSQARKLQSADLVFWVGKEMELGVVSAMESLPAEAEVISLIDLEGLSHAEGHGHHEDDAHKSAHGKQASSDDHKDEHADDHEHGDEEHGAKDPHIWLNPANGITMARAMADALKKQFPEGQEAINTNLAELLERIEVMHQTGREKLAPLHEVGFVSTHQWYGHFADGFSLEGGHALTDNPELPVGAARMAEMQELAQKGSISCFLAEGTHDSRSLDLLSKAAGSQTITIDQLGGELSAGDQNYVEIMTALIDEVANCLKPQS